MSGLEMARMFMGTARTDCRAISNMLDPEVFADNVFGFHAQQAVEKALKAWLYVLQRTHPHTHDLRFLLRSLAGLGQDVEPYLGFIDLNGYAVRFRYEDVPEEEAPLDRPALVRDIGDLLTKVESLIPVA